MATTIICECGAVAGDNPEEQCPDCFFKRQPKSKNNS